LFHGTGFNLIGMVFKYIQSQQQCQSTFTRLITT
jgi:hypothetical protein